MSPCGVQSTLKLRAWIGRTERTLLTLLPESEPDRGDAAKAIANALVGLLEEGRRRAVLISKIDGEAPEDSALAPYLTAAGFAAGSRGYLKRIMPEMAMGNGY